MKHKIGNRYSFRFAGAPFEGVLIEIDKKTVGTVTHEWYKCKSDDGTIYPVNKSELTLIK